MEELLEIVDAIFFKSDQTKSARRPAYVPGCTGVRTVAGVREKNGSKACQIQMYHRETNLNLAHSTQSAKVWGLAVTSIPWRAFSFVNFVLLSSSRHYNHEQTEKTCG